MRTPVKQLALFFCALTAASSLLADSPLDLQTRIVGGSDMSIDYAPSTVALLNNAAVAQSGSYFQSQFCGGTVIDSRWVLTAAHCLVSNSGVTIRPDQLSVLTGSTDLESPVNQPVGVTNIIVHAGFNDRTFANDIALLQLEYDALVPATPLDTQATALNDLALIAGWGALAQENEAGQQYFPGTLQGAFVLMIPGNDCSTMFETYTGKVNDTNLCAGVVEGGIDSCQGDSGGPMYRYDESDPAALRLAGIVSWGRGCANATAPGVYTRVAAFTNWIQSNSGIASGEPQPPIVEPPVVPPVEPPVEPPVVTVAPEVSTTEPAVSNALSVQNPLAASSGWFMFSLLGLMAVYRQHASRTRNSIAAQETATSTRQRMATKSYRNSGHQPVSVDTTTDVMPATQFNWLHCYPYAMVAITLSVLLLAIVPKTCAAVSVSSQAIELDNQPIGGERETVIESAALLWQQEPVCSVVRTGYGVSRRAYFLETCTFAVRSDNTICEAVPSWVEYRFLENSLLQVSFEFEEMLDEDHYRACVQVQADRLLAATDQTISIDEALRTSVSDAQAVAQIRRLQ